jgi:hypothetical protein
MLIIVPLLAIWIGCTLHAIARPDLSIAAKFLWIVAVLALPLIGTVLYIIFYRRRREYIENMPLTDLEKDLYEQPIRTSANDAPTDRYMT